MIKQVIFSLFFSLYWVLAIAQIGQTKAYLIKENVLCKILQNEDALLKLDCEGAIRIFKFEDDLCSIVFIEFPVSIWNESQIDLLRRNLKYYGKDTYPTPENPDLEVDAFLYSDGKHDWLFYDCNIYGDRKAEYKVVSKFKHLK